MHTKREGVFETNSSSMHAIAIARVKISPKDYFNLGGGLRRKKIRLRLDDIDYAYTVESLYEKIQYFTAIRIAYKFGAYDARLRPGDIENDPDMKAWESEVCSKLREAGIDVDGFDYSESYVWEKGSGGKSDGDDDDECDDDEYDGDSAIHVDANTPYTNKAALCDIDIDHQVVEDGPDSAGKYALIEGECETYGSGKDETKVGECLCRNGGNVKDIDIVLSPNVIVWYGWDSMNWAKDSNNPANVAAEDFEETKKAIKDQR